MTPSLETCIDYSVCFGTSEKVGGEKGKTEGQIQEGESK